MPFEGDVTSLDAEDIKGMTPLVIIKYEKGEAVVHGSFTHCGVGNDLTGKYKKVNKAAK